jgi:hypothetical protein
MIVLCCREHNANNVTVYAVVAPVIALSCGCTGVGVGRGASVGGGASWNGFVMSV